MKKNPRVLLSWEINPGYATPIKFSENQITVCREQKYINHFFKISNLGISAWTPEGTYDLYEFLVENKIETNFDLVVVWSSSARSHQGFYNHPTGIEKFNCPVLLILGDTHHMDEPISSMIEYANSEPFTHIISIYDRQHLHFFSKIQNSPSLGWFPGLSVHHEEREYRENKDFSICCLGNFASAHLYRRQVLDLLSQRSINYLLGTRDSNSSSEIYSNSLISLNVSLNGDLNLRNFEIMCSGGFLLTDRLSEESGQNSLFSLGEHIEVYRDLSDLQKKIDYYLTHPNRAIEIARNGHHFYCKTLQPRKVIERLIKWIFTEEIAEINDVSKDFRVRLGKILPPNIHANRAKKYELLQELVRKNPFIRVGISESLSPAEFLDALDLGSRATIYIRETDQLKKGLIEKYSLQSRVSIVNDLSSVDYVHI